MSLKFIIGIIQIVLSLILIAGMVIGLTTIRSTVKEGIQAGSPRIPENLRSQIDLSTINKIVISSSVLFGVIGILFLLQGLINLKKETPKIEPPKTSSNKKEIKPTTQVDVKEDIPDEY
ncbi:MAG: hypothetical protein ABIB47_04680 [Candidatus Woesearchaeota archaeon]